MKVIPSTMSSTLNKCVLPSDGDKIGAFGIQLDGKAGAWYRALKLEEKDTWATLRGVFILECSPSGTKWSPIN